MTQPGQVHGAREATFGLPMMARGIPAGVFAFLTAATTNWQVPEGVEAIFVEVRGPSGSGGTGSGGAGAYAASYLRVSPGQNFTVVVGATANASTFTGSGITTITANSGGADPGVAGQIGTPGTASGGNVANVTGGGPWGTTGAGGGGAVVIWV